jgi:hypothetical protein
MTDVGQISIVRMFSRRMLRLTGYLGLGLAIGLGSALPSWARTAQLDLALAPGVGITARDLLTQAEQLAQAQVITTFESQPDVTQIKVSISADYAGQFLPILLVQVDRSQWQTQPQIRQYSRYLNTGSRLLGLQPSGSGATLGALPTTRDDVAFRDD